MVLESLINPIKAEKTPAKMVLYGFLYASLAIAVGLWVFYTYASMIFVFLAALVAVPLMYATIKYEESKDMEDLTEKVLLKEHGRALSFLMYLFFGMTLACIFWYTILPSTTVSTLFESQTNTINAINGKITGLFTIEQVQVFTKIFLNNVKVMIFCAIFSLLYGAGAIFILTWNASVIGAAIGNFIRGNLASYAHLVGLDKVAQYFSIIGIGLLKYAIHGVPEILAYFTAGLAGGIISIAIIKHDFQTRKFEHILLDSADLFLVSIGLLFLAAVLEVWVTPLIF
ncbi:stage II sporulation protein M [Candidatus Woesearchaeota archaeon]|nr:stage II sporulation protein M [Candidatus Woesearchaeota archaeon]